MLDYYNMESVDVDKFSAIIIKTEIEDVVETKVKIEYNNHQLEPLNDYKINCNDQLIKTEDFIEEQEPNYGCENIIEIKNEFLIEQYDTENHTNENSENSHEAKSLGRNQESQKLSGHDLIFQEELENRNKKYRCISCGKSFSQSQNLKRHINLVHKGQKECKCETCGKFFALTQHLKRHILTVHEGHKDYKCDFCGKTFTQGEGLKRHVNKIHSENLNVTDPLNLSNYNQKRNQNEEPPSFSQDVAIKYKCNSCSKNFTTAQGLRLHIQTIHDGLRNQNCHLCNKSFHQAQNLRRHIKSVHKGQKECKCETCGKLFALAQHLKRHIHTVHEGRKDHKCEFCGKSFSQGGDLKRHILKGICAVLPT